ncbi:MAG: archease [Candidatus Aenigmatarchaeota archaeon]|nr:MAG: archease [Candidatus Aenigmarchaeota archaeon]
MEKFKFVDITTADVAFEAYGKDLNELFANSALAMFEVMVNTEEIEPKVEREVELEANDLESLLFEWLNELLFYYGSENLAFSRFEVEVDEKELKLKAKCFGEEINPAKHETKTEVKAATYHNLEVKKEDGSWKARVILDI